MAYKIKSVPEDFIVDEITNISGRKSSAKISWKEKMKELRGANKKPVKKYTIFKLRKTNINLFDAIERLSKATGIMKKDFGYAGTKDKKAVTTQMISVPYFSKEKLEQVKIKGIEISDIFVSDKPIKLGDLKGNRFRITVRNIPEKDIDSIKKRAEDIKVNGFKNYFGRQRFSSDNIKIGRALIKKDFEKAANIISNSYPQVRAYLEKKSTDYTGAIKQLPKMLGRMFIHAYQSWIWNSVAESIDEPVMIPLIGSKTELRKYPETRKHIEKIMKKEKILFSDFIIKDIMHLTTRGGERRLFVIPDNFELEVSDDELNKFMKKIVISFELPPGSYATVLIQEIMKLT